MTSQGSEAGQLIRALDNALSRGDLGLSLGCARDLGKHGQVSLEAAAKLLHLLARDRSPLYERAAVRWMARYLGEVPHADLNGVLRVADALAEMPHDPTAAEELLAVLRR